MKNLAMSLLVLFSVLSCTGPGSGPLVRNNVSKTEKSKDTSTQMTGSAVTVEKMNVTIEPGKDCIRISDLLSNKKSFSGKVIRVKGQVTKYNPQIMGKNWIHIQDGSEYQGGFDLTITSDIQVSVGDIVTFEGRIALDKDFGYGYFYNVLMEEGKPIL
jgi:predicted RNA-binding protein